MSNKSSQLTILITGANGTVGCDLVSEFSKYHKVLAFYRTENFFSKSFESKNVIWIKQDLKNKIICDKSPDIIIHGAVTHSFTNKNSDLDYINSNIISLLNMIEFSNKKNIKYFIYLSSITIYGESKLNILNDNNSFNNPNLLSATKILSETLLQNQNFKYCCLRLPGVLCYKNSPNERPWLNFVINQLKSNQTINIKNENALFNNVIDTIEIFNFIQHILSGDFKSKLSFNFAASKPMKLKELIFFIKTFLNSCSRVNFSKEPTNHFTISTETLNKEFNYEVASTKSIISRYLENFK